MRSNVVTKFKALLDPAEVELVHLDRNPKYSVEARDAIARRLEAAERREKVQRARLGGQRSTTSLAAQVKALVAGGSVSASSPADELAAALEEQRILRAALSAENEKLDLLRGEISFEVCKKFEPMHSAAMLAAFEAAQALFAALEAARVARAKIIGAGYSLNDSAMPAHYFETGAMVGDPNRAGSPAARFKDWLIEKGII
jgi:hypothetical protein